MSAFGPRLHRRSISTIVTLMLLAATLLMLIHWHQDSADQRCEICFARNLPGIYVPFAASLAAPSQVEWRPHTERTVSVRTASFQSKTSRAPPTTSF